MPPSGSTTPSARSHGKLRYRHRWFLGGIQVSLFSEGVQGEEDRVGGRHIEARLEHELLGARRCWANGLAYFPGNTVMRNELGNLLVQLGDFGGALREYTEALERGMGIAELNMAVVLELEGRTAESVAAYGSVLAKMQAQGFPHRHIMIKMATVLPRVMPSAASLAPKPPSSQSSPARPVSRSLPFSP